MTLESTLGKGSTFQVHLPLQVAQETAAEEAERASRQRPLSVLLVEGDALAANAMRELLEQQGQRVRLANHGLNALAELALEPCDVMLLALDLPGIDGWQVAQLIRHGEVAGEHVPIVAMSVRGDEEEMARGREVGIDAFVRQPFLGAQLVAAMQEAMAARAAVRREIHTA
jgi:DNA-binding response OmpR family regulator